MPPPLPHREPQLISSPSSREYQSPSQCGRKLLPLADLRHQHDKGSGAGAGGTQELSSLGGRNASTENASSAAASASGLPRLAALAAVPPSLNLFMAASSEALETVVVCDNESTQAMHSGAAFPAAAVAPAGATQPLKSLAVSPSTAPVSLESSSSAAASASLSCPSKPLIRFTAMPTEEGRILPLPAAATTPEEAYLESRVSYPYKGADAMAAFDLANPPPSPFPHVDSADRGGSAATTTAPLLRQQESQISLSESTPRTPPICQERLSPAAGAMKPTNLPAGPFLYPATAPVAEAAACTTSTTVKGVASSSAALTAHPADYGRRTNIGGTLRREAGGAAAFEHAPPPQQQQQQPSCPPRTSGSFATAAATYPTTAAAPGSPSGPLKMQPSSLLSRMTTPAAAGEGAAAGVGSRDDSSDIDRTPPRLITSVASSLLVPLAVSETSTERTRSTPAGSIDSLCVYGAPPPPFPRAPSDATRPGSPTSFSPVAVTARAGVAMDAVGYLERGYDTLWRTLARFFAAAFLPHIFVWHAVSALIPKLATSAAAEAAAPPRVRLHAVACNHPEVVLFALELFVAGVMLWSLARYRQLSTVQRSRRHHSLHGGLHHNSTSLAARPSSAGVSPASVAAARIAAEWGTAHLPTTITTKKLVDSAESPSTSIKMAGMRPLSSARGLRLRPLRSPGAGGIGSGLNSCGVPGSSNSVRSSGHAHCIFSHATMPLLHLPLRPFGGVWSAATMAARAAISGSATPVRDPANFSSCPSEPGGTMRCFGGRSVSGGLVSDSTLSSRSSASSVATPSLSLYTFMGLATPAAEVMQRGLSDAHGIDSLLTPGDAGGGGGGGGGAVTTLPTPFEAEESRSGGGLLHRYPPRTAPWDVSRLQQPSRELLSGSAARFQRGFPASPPTSVDLHASPFSALNSTGHAPLALAGLGDRDGTLAKSTDGAVAIQPSVVTPAAAAVAASAVRTDSLLLSPGGAVTAAPAPSSPIIGRDGPVPTMTYFGIGLGFLVCTGLAVWRLSVDYYFARYSFALDTNAALWFWLVPVCLLGIAAYVVLLIGGHTLRWRALRQLQESTARGCHNDDENEEEAARQGAAAAAAALCRLRWMSWCLACVPYPYPDVALFFDLPESVIMRPDATALLPILASRGSMAGAFAVDESDAVPPVVLCTPRERGLCDDGDEMVCDGEVSARGSSLRQQSEVLRVFGKDKDGEGVFLTSDDTLEPVDDILRLKRETPEQSTPAPDISGDVGSLAAATALDNFKTASLRTTTTAAAADVSGSPCKPLLPPLLPRRPLSRFCSTAMVRSFLIGRRNVSGRDVSPSSASSQSLWIFGQRPQRIRAAAHVFAESRAWVERAARRLHIPDLIMRLRRLCGLAQQRRAERRRPRVAPPTASAERRLRTWWSGERGSLECLVAWTYLIMLFLFSQALLSLMYFTWSWRTIAGEAATATMYATDTGRAEMPVPPSFVVYGCTKWQRSLRHALWVIPPFCVSGDVSVSSPRPSTTWSMASQVALLFTLLGQRRFQVAYLYTNIALPIGFVISVCILAQEVRLHIKSRRLLRLLALAKSRVETARKVRDAML